MTTKFTPGPWNKDKRSENLVGSNGKNVVLYDSGLSFAGLPSDESHANARLIAAAPEMYWSLKGLLELSDLMQRFGADGMNPEWKAGVLSDAHAVLAKANGGAQ